MGQIAPKAVGPVWLRNPIVRNRHFVLHKPIGGSQASEPVLVVPVDLTRKVERSGRSVVPHFDAKKGSLSSSCMQGERADQSSDAI